MLGRYRPSRWPVNLTSLRQIVETQPTPLLHTWFQLGTISIVYPDTTTPLLELREQSVRYCNIIINILVESLPWPASHGKSAARPRQHTVVETKENITMGSKPFDTPTAILSGLVLVYHFYK